MKLTRILLLFSIILEGVCLWIDCHLFYNMGIYVDEHNASWETMYGGMGWLYGEWLILFALAVLLVISLVLFLLTFRRR